ncbi:MAG TPA: MFS transporter [Solirubrobacteraceae bacterium]|nr:MFS transporter [Solirubrobacteraceae bacterium]
MTTRLPRALTPLRNRSYALLLAGQLSSNVGDMLYAVALPWYVLATHGGALLLATVLAAYGIPRTVLIAVGGHASDRFKPWTVMMGADAVRAAAAAALGIAAASGRADAAVLIAIAITLGAGEGMFLPASYSIIPSLVGGGLQAANALSSANTQLATLLGPAVGGVLVATLGPSPAFGIDAATFVISALTLARIRAARHPAAAHSTDAVDDPGDRDDRTAPAPSLLRFVRSQPLMQLVLVVNVAGNLGSGAVSEVALPALAHGPFQAGASGYGAMIAAFGAGALAGTLTAGQARQFMRPAVIASIAFLLDALAQALVPYLGGVERAAVALAALGALNGFANILTLTAFQRWAPPALMGRVMGLMMLTSMGVFPVSVMLGGIVVVHLGAAAVFPLASATIVLAVGFALTQPVWRRFGMARSARATAVEHPSMT